jgi:hypothetical protein
MRDKSDCAKAEAQLYFGFSMNAHVTSATKPANNYVQPDMEECSEG